MKSTIWLWVVGLVLGTAAEAVHADGPKDNIPENVRQIPPPGIALSAEDEADLQKLSAQLQEVRARVGRLGLLSDSESRDLSLLTPDMEIFQRAVDQALTFRELYSKREIDNAKMVAREGLKRGELLANRQTPWTRQKGLVVRGFRSRIDQTVQPYGLVIPESYDFDGGKKFRLDLWFHGRGERTGETQFISQRMKSVGQYAPTDTFVLHPYGRYSNAFKFAGEIDVLEALEHVKQHYRIDEDRISVRGFSMGGAGCWQMAVHYPDLFFANNPGAGFSETPEFLKFFQKETLDPTWYEKKLWRMYDCNGYAANLFHLPTVAYSGEKDIQKQAADIMEEALSGEGIRLRHIIGPDTGHRIHPDSKKVIEASLDSLATRGRQRVPHELHFVTYTLRYNRMHWLTVTGLGEHWEQARVDARLDAASNRIALKTKNVTSLKLQFDPGLCPLQLTRPVTASIDGERLTLPRPASDLSLDVVLHKADGRWQIGSGPTNGLRKQHLLQGPIDDAFMDSFIVVRPSGKARHKKIEKWTQSELAHCVAQWRQQFRGDAVVMNDVDVDDDSIAANNLILFGDPDSNAVLKKVLPKLPIQWTGDSVVVGDKAYNAAQHAPILIYPNPLNPNRYVVLNSGFTYREYAYLNNARQVPKLPDWAVVDVDTPADSLWPGRVVDANFFDEAWKLK